MQLYYQRKRREDIFPIDPAISGGAKPPRLTRVVAGHCDKVSKATHNKREPVGAAKLAETSSGATHSAKPPRSLPPYRR